MRRCAPGSTRSIRLWALGAAVGFLAVAVAVRMLTGDGHGGGRWAQHSGTALYASMVYVGVLFVWPRIAVRRASILAAAFCWLVEAAQVTGIPADLSRRSLVARVVLGVQFDWIDMLWYPVGIVPLAAADWLLAVRSKRMRVSVGDRQPSVP